ncbi:MAG: hypothetical protein AB1765_10255 [Candidatus Hydrogenedentota bacterium]
MNAVCALHYCVLALSCFLPLASCFYLILLELQCFSEEIKYGLFQTHSCINDYSAIFL